MSLTRTGAHYAIDAVAEPAARLRALGHPVRLALSRALQARPGAAVPVAELSGLVGRPPGPVARHLRALAAVGLVTSPSPGRYAGVAAAVRDVAGSVQPPVLGPLAPGAADAAAPERLRILSRIAEQVADGVVTLDNDGWVVYANPAFADLHGYPVADLAGRHMSSFYPAEEQDNCIRDLIAASLEHGVARIETVSTRRCGSTFPSAMTQSLLHDDAGELIGRVLTVTDISERRRLEDELRRQALTDPLTGLPNRRLLIERLERALVSAARTCEPVAVLFIDLDHFKAVNDEHGHEVGDRLLVAVADRLSACLRARDTLARLGGDEFAVVLPGTDRAAATLVAERLTRALAPGLDLGATVVAVRASIGMAVDGACSAGLLLDAADAAMYRVKSARRRRSRAGGRLSTV